jgi:hypothetical protein
MYARWDSIVRLILPALFHVYIYVRSHKINTFFKTILQLLQDPLNISNKIQRIWRNCNRLGDLFIGLRKNTQSRLARPQGDLSDEEWYDIKLTHFNKAQIGNF